MTVFQGWRLFRFSKSAAMLAEKTQSRPVLAGAVVMLTGWVGWLVGRCVYTSCKFEEISVNKLVVIIQVAGVCGCGSEQHLARLCSVLLQLRVKNPE